MNRLERMIRNEKIVTEVKAGKAANTIADEFGLSMVSIVNVCRANGLKISTKERLNYPARPFVILLDLCTSNLLVHAIAEKNNCSIQRVTQILCNAIAAGWDVPNRMPKPVAEEAVSSEPAVDETKKEESQDAVLPVPSVVS